jgi:hypothetical protein
VTVEGAALMTRRARARRADAERQARNAKAARDAAREAHERAIEKALADYFEARARAEAIRTAARARADAALADGERAAAESMTAVCAAIRTLRDLCASNAEVAELCGVPVADVRELLAAVARAGSGDQGDNSSQEEPGPSEASAEAGICPAALHPDARGLPDRDEPGSR